MMPSYIGRKKEKKCKTNSGAKKNIFRFSYFFFHFYRALFLLQKKFIVVRYTIFIGARDKNLRRYSRFEFLQKIFCESLIYEIEITDDFFPPFFLTPSSWYFFLLSFPARHN